MKMKRKAKNGWTIALAVLLIVGALSGLLFLFRGDSVDIRPSAFKIGGLNEEGKYEKRTDAIYTEKAFSCQGLKITPAFDAEVEYQIFFYDEDDRFLEATEVLTGAYSEERLLPSYARVMIFADTTDENGDYIEDFELRRWDVRRVARGLEITVDAKQDKKYTANLFDVEEGVDGVSAKIRIKDYESVLLHLVDTDLTNTVYTVTFYAEKTNADGVSSTMRELDDLVITLQNYEEGEFMWYMLDEIPSGATHMTITYSDDNTNIGVYGVE